MALEQPRLRPHDAEVSNDLETCRPYVFDGATLKLSLQFVRSAPFRVVAFLLDGQGSYLDFVGVDQATPAGKCGVRVASVLSFGDQACPWG